MTSGVGWWWEGGLSGVWGWGGGYIKVLNFNVYVQPIHCTVGLENKYETAACAAAVARVSCATADIVFINFVAAHPVLLHQRDDER